MCHHGGGSQQKKNLCTLTIFLKTLANTVSVWVTHSRCLDGKNFVDIIFLPNHDLNLKALEMGAVETLICWEDLNMQQVGARFLFPLKSMKRNHFLRPSFVKGWQSMFYVI